MIARRVSLVAALAFALAGSGTALAATHRTSHHAKTQHMARPAAAGNSTPGCPNMGNSPSSASSAA